MIRTFKSGWRGPADAWVTAACGASLVLLGASAASLASPVACGMSIVVAPVLVSSPVAGVVAAASAVVVSLPAGCQRSGVRRLPAPVPGVRRAVPAVSRVVRVV